MRQTIVSLLFVAGSAFGQSVTISAPVFAGAGLNDAVSGGQFRLFPTNASYAATISATGTPDRFTWAKNGGAASAPVNIAGGTCALPALAGARGWQALADGVLICWPSNTGHTLAGTWTIKASATGRPGFISRIIDAVARTAEDKARDVLSALDAGAKADGVTVDRR